MRRSSSRYFCPRCLDLFPAKARKADTVNTEYPVMHVNIINYSFTFIYTDNCLSMKNENAWRNPVTWWQILIKDISKDTQCVVKVATVVSQHKQIRDKNWLITCLQCIRVRCGGSCLQSLTLSGDDNILVLFNVKALLKGAVSNI